jgi:flagellar basal-body rod modification protein FlgD
MAVSSTTSAADATAAASSLTASTSDAKATSERFLKLLVAQMQNQDPAEPDGQRPR